MKHQLYSEAWTFLFFWNTFKETLIFPKTSKKEVVSNPVTVSIWWSFFATGSEIFYNFPDSDKLSFSFHNSLPINFTKSISKDPQNNNIRIFWTNSCIGLLLSCMENHSIIGFFLVAVKDLCGTTWNFECFIFVVNQYWPHWFTTEYVKNKGKRCRLFLMLWRNANHSLLNIIFCSKLWKCTGVSGRPLSFVV